MRILYQALFWIGIVVLSQPLWAEPLSDPVPEYTILQGKGCFIPLGESVPQFVQFYQNGKQIFGEYYYYDTFTPCENLPVGVLTGYHASPSQPNHSFRLIVKPNNQSRVSLLADLLDELIVLGILDNLNDPAFLESAFDKMMAAIQKKGINTLYVQEGSLPLLQSQDKLYCAPKFKENPSLCQSWQEVKKIQKTILESGLRETIKANQGDTTWIDRIRVTDSRVAEFFLKAAKKYKIKLNPVLSAFEGAYSKYTGITLFDENAEVILDAAQKQPFIFHEAAPLELMLFPEKNGLAHYRTLFKNSTNPNTGKIASLKLTLSQGVNPAQVIQAFETGMDNIRLYASKIPPLDHNSWGVQKQAEGFQIILYKELGDFMSKNRIRIPFTLKTSWTGQNHVLHFENLSVPEDYAYLLIEGTPHNSIMMSSNNVVELISHAGSKMGLNSIYISSKNEPNTLVSGYLESGRINTEFYAHQTSHQLFANPNDAPLDHVHTLVINRGQSFTSENFDWNQPAAQQYAVRVLKGWNHYLGEEGFETLMIQSRSHFELPGQHQTLAYLPLISRNERVITDRLGSTDKAVEELTLREANYFKTSCLTENCVYPLRFARNKGIKRGIESLIRTLESEFPNRNIQVLIGEQPDAQVKISTGIQHSEGPQHYFDTVDSTNYYLPVVEGLSMLDLSNTKAISVIPGIFRGTADKNITTNVLNEQIRDKYGNRGSNYKGALAYHYGAQTTADSGEGDLIRQKTICTLLSNPLIENVILYEAYIYWMYRENWIEDSCGY